MLYRASLHSELLHKSLMGYDPESPQSRVRPWYAETRGIYSTNNQVTVTGLGIILFRNKLYAPIDSDLSYVEVGIDTLESWRICDPSHGRWCFGFHNSCWRLLLLRLGHAQYGYLHNETVVVESIFYQLCCTPCLDYSSFQWSHDYGGAARTHILYGRIQAVDLSLPFYTDPFVIPSMDDLEATAPEGKYYPIQRVNGVCGSSASDGGRHPLPSHHNTIVKMCESVDRPNHHILNGLSPELRFEIFSYLSFNELLNLRLICRELALPARLNTLPQSYWQSRFLLGQEADFVFPRLTDIRDWCRLYSGTRASLNAELLPLVNRKRIRLLLEPIAALVDLEGPLRNGPYGSAFHPAQGQDGSLQLFDGEGAERPAQAVHILGSFSGQLVSTGANSTFDEGCRELYHRTLSFLAPRQQHPWRIGILTIRIGRQNFISGLNLSPSRG